MIWIAAAVAVLLATVAPKPAWVGLAIAALGATVVRSFVPALPRGYERYDNPCLHPEVTCSAEIRMFPADGSGLRNSQYLEQNQYLEYSRAFATPLQESQSLFATAVGYGEPATATNPMWVIAIGVLAWGIRRRSWRMIVAAALFAGAVWAMRDMAPLVLFVAAAAAAGPRKDVHFLAGLGILALALTADEQQWQLIITIVAVLVASAIGIWALIKKNGFNGAVAIATLASAPLTPFLAAGVLLAAAVYQNRGQVKHQNG